MSIVIGFGVETRCANCGIALNSNDGYTSMQWQNDIGFGYLVCDYCHELENIARENEK